MSTRLRPASAAGSLLVIGIGQLVTNDPAHPDGDGSPLGVIADAALLAVDGRIAWTGRNSDASQARETAPGTLDEHPVETVDAGGRAVIPGFVDSHSHLVFAGDRTEEFAARMAGESYAAGGIRTTVAATREASDEELEENLQGLLAEAGAAGTTTIEIKSGYGLTTADELRSVRIAARHTDEVTFLAHIPAPEFAGREDAYVEQLIAETIPACAPHARWADVFCEAGAFTPAQSRAILDAAAAHGLRPRLHANQLGPGPGLQLAAELGCASADHATHASDADLAALAASGTVATLLPGAEFSTRSRYPDARRFHAAGVTVALASDCNPGTSFTTNMPFCIAVAVRDMFFTPAQALWSATAGGAAALRRDDIGALARGTRADFSLLRCDSYAQLAYRPGVPLIADVYRGGERIAAPGGAP